MVNSKSVKISATSLMETLSIGQSIGANLKGGEVVELAGDLGSGKTSLVKGIVKGTGSKDLVSSPSFTICNEYRADKFRIYHFDFYRLNEPGIIRRELSEVMGADNNVIVIEWPEVIEDILPEERTIIELAATAESGRVIKINYPVELGYLTKNLA
jgi:tRNA threonylcarbamoyladenosine biosynthesis protein TsaE